MASTKLIFNADEVQRLRTKISQVSQDTNRLYLQLKGQASGWNGIPMGDHLVKAQVLINELTVESEKLEDVIRTALKGVEGLQEENKQKANQLTQRFSLFAGMFGSFRAQSITGQTAIPTAARKAASNLITSFAALLGRDELDSDPAVKQLRIIIQTAGLGTVEAIAAQSKLKDIFAARDQIAKAQLAYKVYETFGNKTQMNVVHLQAEEARQKLASLGVDEVHYEAGKDLSVYFKQPALQACDYDPSIKTGSVPLVKHESYLLLLRMSMEPGNKGEWAKEQLEALHQGGRSLLLTNPNAEAWREILNQAMVRSFNNVAEAEKSNADQTDWESKPAKKDFIDKYLVDPLIKLFTGEEPEPKTQLQQVLEAQFYGMQVEQQFILSDFVSEFESTMRGAASADRVSEVLEMGTINVKTGTNKNGPMESAGGITGSGFGKIRALDEVEDISESKPLLDDFNPVIRGVGGTGGAHSSVISPEMEKKILDGQRKTPTKNELIGGHSPNINNSNPNYAVQEITVNADGTKKVKFTTQFPDGNLSNIKTSTLFPDTWSDSQIIGGIKEIGDTVSMGVRASDGAILHRGTVNGVQIEVIKIGDSVVSGYPTGGGATQLLSGFTAP